jgi:hypothetical protein
MSMIRCGHGSALAGSVQQTGQPRLAAGLLRLPRSDYVRCEHKDRLTMLPAAERQVAGHLPDLVVVAGSVAADAAAADHRIRLAQNHPSPARAIAGRRSRDHQNGTVAAVGRKPGRDSCAHRVPSHHPSEVDVAEIDHAED